MNRVAVPVPQVPQLPVVVPPTIWELNRPKCCLCIPRLSGYTVLTFVNVVCFSDIIQILLELSTDATFFTKNLSKFEFCHFLFFQVDCFGDYWDLFWIYALRFVCINWRFWFAYCCCEYFLFNFWYFSIFVIWLWFAWHVFGAVATGIIVFVIIVSPQPEVI